MGHYVAAWSPTVALSGMSASVVSVLSLPNYHGQLALGLEVNRKERVVGTRREFLRTAAAIATALAIRKASPLHPCFNIDLANGF